MKKLRLVLCTLLFALFASGCMVAPVMPPAGLVFTNYQAPLDYDQQESKIISRKGTSETICILGLISVGDASINKAAENGGLTVAHGADYEYFNVLFVFQRYQTIVRGE